jgi:hypothetical protein
MSDQLYWYGCKIDKTHEFNAKEFSYSSLPPKRPTLHKRKFRVLLRLSKNSDLVEFTDNGQQEVICRACKRKVKQPEHPQLF